MTEKGFGIQGPAYTEYGFGWAPTITFWSGLRRVHFYFDIITYKHGVTVEVSEIRPNEKIKRGNVDTNSKVMRGTIKTADEAWSIVEKFVHEQQLFENLPNCGWFVDTLDHDKFIPHPPDASNPANIVNITKNPNVERWES